MPANKKLLILAGDGIGPEVMAQVKRVLDWFAKNQALSFDTEDELVGGCSIDQHGVPLTDAAMEKAMKADAVLLGAVGGPKWDNLPFAQKPERGLLASAQGHGAVRQPAPRAGVRRAGGCLEPEDASWSPASTS